MSVPQLHFCQLYCLRGKICLSNKVTLFAFELLKEPFVFLTYSDFQSDQLPPGEEWLPPKKTRPDYIVLPGQQIPEASNHPLLKVRESMLLLHLYLNEDEFAYNMFIMKEIA